MSEEHSLIAGQRVGGGRFTLMRELGRGGMGVVWLAQDTNLGEQAALKFLPPEIRGDPVALDDLRRETARSRRLTHANIVRIHDLHEHSGEPAFISMEYVDGLTLSALRLQQPERVFGWDYLRPIVEQLCAALGYAHGEGVVHRDLKPANLMLDGKGRLKLADFGIAAVVSDSVSRVSAPKTSGTLAYMSPQQLTGRRPTVTDDMYALGASLYELLTGKPPFYTGDLTHQILHEAPEAMDERLGAQGIENPVPAEVAALIMACLAKDPAQRPDNAQVVAEWIGLGGAPALQAPATPVSKPGSVRTRRGWWLGLGGAAALLLLLGLAVLWKQHRAEQIKGMPGEQRAATKPVRQAGAAGHPLVGTWEFVSARTPDGKEDEQYIRWLQGKRYLKMITPTHFACLHIDLSNGRITGSHGGECRLGDGQFSELPLYFFTTPRADQPRAVHFTVRFEGNRFLQRHQNGTVETWRRASIAMVNGAREDGALTDRFTSQTNRGVAQAVSHALVGTWEFVSARTPDGKEDERYIKASQGKRSLKMITPTHYALLYIDLATGQVTGAHGGGCGLADGQLSECTQFSTTPGQPFPFGTTHRLKVEVEGDKFVQMSEDGGAETWRRASEGTGSEASTAGQTTAKQEGAVTPAVYSPPPAAQQASSAAMALSPNAQSSTALPDQGPAVVWAQRIGGSGEDFPLAIKVDGQGNTYVTGYFEGVASFGGETGRSAGGKDIFLVSFDNAGRLRWARQAGGPGEDWGRHLALDPRGNINLTGWFERECTFGNTRLTSAGRMGTFLVQYDPSGRLLWARSFGGTGTNLNKGEGLALDKDGNLLFCGLFSGTAKFGAKSLTSTGAAGDGFLAKLDAQGTPQWVQTMALSAPGTFCSMGLDIVGNCYVMGWFRGSASLGSTTLRTEGDFDLLLAKYNAKGELQWVRQAGGKGLDFSVELAVDSRGNCYLFGTFQQAARFGEHTLVSSGDTDVFLANYNCDGAVEWAKKIKDGGRTDWAGGYGIVLAPNGHCYLAGHFVGSAVFGKQVLTSTGSQDAYMVECDESGAVIWAEQFGGTGMTGGRCSVAMDPAGNLYLTGTFDGTLSFNGTRLVSAGNQDVFVAKLGRQPQTSPN
jgi:hypothetical protein